MAGLNTAYLTTKFGILKIIEFVVCLLAFSLCAGFRDAWSIGYHSSTHSRIAFFIFVAVTAWIFVVLMIVVNVSNLIQKFTFTWKDLFFAILHGVAAVMFLIAGALCADNARKWHDFPGTCRWVDMHTSTTCATHSAGVVFGFIALIFFAIDAVFYLMASKGGSKEQSSDPKV